MAAAFLHPLPTSVAAARHLARAPLRSAKPLRLARPGIWASAATAAPAGSRFAAGLSLLLLAAPSRVKRLRSARWRSQLAAASEGNTALVFIKPHASTQPVKELLPTFLKERGIEVLRQGVVAAAEIDSKGIIDSHYAAIAKIGMERDMEKMGLGEKEAAVFLKGYGKPLQEAMAAGEVHSAATALEELKVSPSELLSRCLAAGYEKLRSGLYCAKLATDDGGEIYVMNGFYARMREKFVAPGVEVPWFVVQFQASELKWSAFRQSVIGATQPVDAADGSLRAYIRDEWQALGLKEETNYQDNGVHASAGPLESLHERQIWAGESAEEDGFAAALGDRCAVPLAALLENSAVTMNGKSGPVFDLLEDVDASDALEMLAGCQLAE